MQLINRKLNADIYDTGNKDAKKRIIKQAVISNGLNSPDLITGEILPTDKTAKAEINGTSTYCLPQYIACLYYRSNSPLYNTDN